MKVYLASPFFNEEEIEVVEFVEKTLAAKGLEVFSPRKDQLPELKFGTREWANAIYHNDIKHVEWADVVVAVHSDDSGTNMEIGYAVKAGKPVIIFDDNTMLFRNLMLTESCHAWLQGRKSLKEYSFDKFVRVPYEGEVI
jgi:nucleoside 2-deoxyribosyltransferase